MFDRRQFLQTTSAAAMVASTAATVRSSQEDPTKRVVVGIMGLSRGLDLAKDLSAINGVVIKYACETDKQRAAAGAKRITELGQAPEVVGDFRRILDDKDVDALICAAPNHWHGPATILGCKAGKHVYVEKPCSHNPAEGEWMIQASEKYKRCVQMGTQRRSSASIQEAIRKLREGVIGDLHVARANFQRMRGSIGTKQPSQPPAHLDFDLWQGPAPRRPFRENIIPYNWHWFWHYGNGELGNNGVHLLDVCRWGMGVEYPKSVISSGGRYYYEDDQETPDTHAVVFEFEGKKQITYQGLSCTQHPSGPFVMFYGSNGSLEIDGDGGYKIFDAKNKEIENVKAAGGEQRVHLTNFVDAIRNDDPKRLQQPILEGHRSTLLCHLGNIAQRTGLPVHCDPKNGHIQGNAEQQALWRREYDSKWENDIVNV